MAASSTRSWRWAPLLSPKRFLSRLAETVWQECGTPRPRDVHRDYSNAPLQARAAPWSKFPRAALNYPSSVTAAESTLKKPLWQRWHECPCGVSAQRDLYSAFLAAYLDPADLLPSCAQPRYAAGWEGREPGLRAAYEQAIQRASAGQHCASQLRYPRRRSASAQKSSPSHTRACLLSRAAGNVEARRGTRPRFSPERSQSLYVASVITPSMPI